MPNDTSTLSGALLEMKDQLIYELGQKGVTASYDSSTGLLGLIGEISNIQTGGSCYHIEFSEASYVAVGGSATLEVYLQSNYQPLSGATVTFTGSDSSSYTGITNSNGVATATVTSISSNTTFTCSYSNVSDTCEVIVQSHLYAPLLDGTEQIQQLQGTTTVANGEMSGGAAYLKGGWDNTIDWELTADVYFTSSDGMAFCLYAPTDTSRDNNVLKMMGRSYGKAYSYLNGSSQQSGGITGITNGSWMTVKMTKEGSNISISVNGNTATTFTYRYTSFSTICVGVDTWSQTTKVKNIIVDSL